MTDPRRPGRWVAAFIILLLASAAVFVIGVAVERNQTHTETTATAPHTEAGTDSGETQPEPGEGAHSDESGSTPNASTTETGSETLLRVNPESIAAVVAAVLVSVLLAGAAWFRPVRPVLLAGAAFCLAAAALDIREVTHQLNENRNGIAALAVPVIVLHMMAAAAAITADHTIRSGTAPAAAAG
jgi:hypothetical protein